MIRIHSLNQFLVLALAAAASFAAPKSSQADWFDARNHGFSISLSTPEIPQHSGQSAKIQGTLRWKHAHSQGQLPIPWELLSQVEIQAFFPDPTHPVSIEVNRNSGTFQFDTPALSRSDLNVFTLMVRKKGATRSRELEKVQAKLDRRVVLLTDQINRLKKKGNVPEKFVSLLVELRDKLVAISKRADGQLAQDPEILAQYRFPLQVDNQVSAPSLYSTLIGGFRYEFQFAVGSAIQGEKTHVTAKITNLRAKFPQAVWEELFDKGTQWVARFFWNNRKVKEFGPDGPGLADTLIYEFDTQKLKPSDSNLLSAEIYRVDGKDQSNQLHLTLFGEVEMKEPVAVDTVNPLWAVESATPDAQHPYVQNMQPVSVHVEDAFGLIDPLTFQAQLTGSLITGEGLQEDVTSRLRFATSDAGQTYLGTGDLNPLAEGLYTLSLRAKDLAENAAQPEPFRAQFRVDRTAPVITLGVQDHYLTNIPAWNIPVTVLDHSPAETVVLQNVAEITRSDAPAFDAALTLQEGLNLLEVRSTDAAGNSASVHLVDVTLDTIPPVLSAVVPAEGAVINVLSIPVSGKSNEPLSYAKVNGQALTLSPDKKSFSGTYTVQTEGLYTLMFETADLATNVTTVSRKIQVLLRALNGDLLSVVPDPDGTHLIIKGAAGATRPGLTVNANSNFFNRGSAVGASDGSFSIKLYAFREASVSAYDPQLNRSDSATVRWGADASTLLSGAVRDTNDQPLAHVRVSLAGTTTEPVFTDERGVFVFKQPVTGDQTLVVDGSTVPQPQPPAPQRAFSQTRISISIGLTQSNVLPRPIYLAPLILEGTGAGIPVENGVETLVTNENAPGVEIKIPGEANIVTFPNRSHSGKISMATIPSERSTIKPFDFASPTQVVALEPSGLSFSKPVELTLPNIYDLPAGVELVIMSMNSQKGIWEIDGAARVSEDGSKVRTKPGMGITHFSTVYASPLGPTVKQLGGADRPGANTFDGALTQAVKMPSYKVLGEDVSPSLLYRSSWAKPTTLIINLFDIPRHEISLDRDDSVHQKLEVPVCIGICFSKDVDIYADISIRGKAWYEPDFITSQFFTAGLVGEKMTFRGVPNRAQISYATELIDPETKDFLPSGIYPYLSKWEVHLKNIIVGTRTVKQWSSVDETPQITQDDISETRLIEQAFPQDLGGPLFVQNETRSPAGRGWKIGGVQKIANPQDDRVMIEEADGSISTFAINNTITTISRGGPLGLNYDLGIDLSGWPYAYATRQNGSGISKLNLETGANLGVVAGMFDVSGQIAGSAFTSPFGDDDDEHRYTCMFDDFAYSYASSPGQLLGLPSGQVFGTDTNRHLLFQAFNGASSAYAAAWGTPPAFRADGTGRAGAGIYLPQISAFCNGQLGMSCNRIRGNAYVVCEFDEECDSGGWYLNYADNCESAYFHDWGMGFQWQWLQSSGSYPVATFNGDGHISRTAFNRPMGISAGPRPNTIVVADTGNNRVRLVDFSTGQVTTIAGTSQFLNYSDGDPAIQAGIKHPRGVVYDAAGNLYISSADENGTGLIRKVDPTGIISTFAGTLSKGQFVDTIEASRASFLNPYGMAVDNQNGYLYVADTGHHRVVRLDFLTHTVKAVAGNGSAADSVDGQAALAGGLSGPKFVGLDDSLNLIIADSGNNKIKRVVFQNSTSAVLAFNSLSSSRPGVRKNPDGSWVPALTRDKSGNWIRNYRNGNQTFFDVKGRQTGSVDRIGNRTTFAYDAQGRLVSVTDPTGRSIVYEYGGDKLLAIHDPGHAQPTRFAYGLGGTLTLITYPDGSTRRYTYRDDGLMSSSVDANGIVTYYEYNEWNRLVGTHHDSGPKMAIADSGSQTVGNKFVGGATGQLKSVGTEENGVIDSVQDPNGNPVQVAKDARGYAGITTDPAGITTEVHRNVEGKPIRIVRSDGTEQTFEYDPTYGDLIRQSDTATGITTQQTFDDFGNLLTITNGRGYTYTTKYDTKGQIIAKIDPRGYGQSNPAGFQSTYTYNGLGQVLTSQDLNGLVSTLSYDSWGNVLTRKDNANHVTRFAYDAAGNVLTAEDANGRITRYEYDVLNRLIAVVTPKNERTEYTYGLTGELLQIKDALGNVSSFEYDALGRMVRKVDALGLVTQLAYDKNGNLIQEIDPNGNVKKYEYNADNKLVQKILPDNVVSLSYDSRKNLIQARDSVSQVDLEYDRAGRLILAHSHGHGVKADLPQVVLTFGRDANGNRTQLQDPVKVSNYHYDELDRMTGFEVTDRSSGAAQSYAFAYDNGSRLRQITRPGSVTKLAFDNASFLESMVHSSGATPIASFAFQRDAIGNITQIATSSMTRVMAYDENNQVVSATNPEAQGSKRSETFAYDKIYNRKSDQDGQYTYDDKSLRLVSDYRYFYFYDNNGNLRSKQARGLTGEVTNYFYSSENQLTGFKVYVPGEGAYDPEHLWTPTSVAIKEVSYTYDALGRRIEKVVLDRTAELDPAKSFTRRYVYDGQEVLLEYDGSNQLLAYHTHSTLRTDDILATEITEEGAQQKLGQSAGVYQYLKDALGSIVDVTDRNGNRLEHLVYSAFGELIGIQNALAQDISTQPVLTPYFTFAGRERDSESGLYYNRARYLDPTIGRFLQKDPHPGALQVPATVVNSYVYGANNPFNVTDPSGQSVLGVIAGVVLIAVAVVVAAAAVVAIAAIAGAVGGIVGGAVGSGLLGGGLLGSIAGGVAGGAVGSLVGGAIGAAAGGLAGGLVSGGAHLVGGGEFGSSFAEAVSAGVPIGAAIGGVVGAAVGGYAGGTAGAKAGAVKPAGLGVSGNSVQLAWSNNTIKECSSIWEQPTAPGIIGAATRCVSEGMKDVIEGDERPGGGGAVPSQSWMAGGFRDPVWEIA